MLRRGLAALAIASILGCPREGSVAPDGGRGAEMPLSDASTGPADTGIPGCDVVWDPSSSIVLPVATRAFELEGACAGDHIVAAWRADATVSAASRGLTPDAVWHTLQEPITTDATALGDALGTDGVAWLSWQSALGWLRVARIEPGRTRTSGPIALVGITLSDPHVLAANADFALIVATARSRDDTSVMLLRLGVTTAPPLTGYVLGQGTVVSAVGGHPAFVAWVTTPAHRPGVLHGVRVDTASVLALERPPGFVPLPTDATVSEGTVEIGGGAFDFAQTAAARAGGVLFQPVTPTGRGFARVAWFPRQGEPRVRQLGVSPAALAGVIDGDSEGDLALRYWDAHSQLVTETVSDRAVEATHALALPLTEAVDGSLGTREIACGGRRWMLYALRTSGVTRLYAEPLACVVR